MTEPTERPATHAHAVSNGIVRRLSVSQLKKHKLCPRAWFYQKVMRYPEPQTGAQKVGTEGHAQLEHYLASGDNVLGPFARAGLHLLPEPGPDLLIEQQLDGEPPLTASGVPFTGFIDLVNPRALASAGVLRITDHKFTSSIAENAASPAQLGNADTEPGLQMVGYGRWAIAQADRFPGLRELELEHIYYQTRGHRLAESVLLRVPIAHVEHEWRSKVEPQVERMKEHARASRASDVPANFGPACSKYGGCPFMAKCLSGETKTMSLRDRLLNKPPQPGAAPPAEQLGFCRDCGAQLNRENTSKLQSGDVKHIRCPNEPPAVLPPDAPAPAPVQPTPALEQPAPVQPPPSPEQPAPKRRGRPPKNRQQQPAASPERPAPPPVPVQPAPEPEQAAPRSSTDLRVLFIDCLPTRYDGPVPEPLTAYVDAMARKVAEAGGVDDLRFAGPDSPLGFGKWRGALAMAARAELPPPGAYLALGLAHSELLQVVVEAIEPAFDVIVRGVR